MALIVIHADKSVCDCTTFREEGSIRRQGAYDSHSKGASSLDSRSNDEFLLAIPKEPSFSSVGIESADC